MQRLEYKYLVPIEYLSRLRERIAPFVEVDPYTRAANRNPYSVRSIYWDTLTLNFYHDKHAGLKDRIKLRMRAYDADEKNSKVFLEIKQKRDAFLTKHRVSCSYAELERYYEQGLSDGAAMMAKFSPEDLCEFKRFFFYIRKLNLHPIILVVFEREAYLHRFNRNLRITFDLNLRSAPFPGMHLFRGENLKLSLPNHFILEIKFFGALPQWMPPLIQEFRMHRLAFSKYTISVDTHFKQDRFTRGKILGHHHNGALRALRAERVQQE